MDKIKWGILGTANICEGCTIPGMTEAENCELYAIAGRNQDKADSFKNKYGFKKAYGSYEDLLKDDEVEAVYIALPNTLHYEWTIKALEHKKHVLCEKPIAPTAEEAMKMFNTAKENSVYLMEAFAYLHSPYISAVKAEIDKVTIGEVKYIESAFITSDYDMSNIRMRKESLGGSVYDLGVYNTSFMLRMLGKNPMDIKAVSSFSEEGIDTFTNVLMEYENGTKASFSCGMVLATERDRRLDRFEIHGTKGEIKGTCFEFNGNGKLSYSVELFGGEKEIKEVEVPHNYRLEVEQLGRCISDGEKPSVTEEFSVLNAEMIDEILKKIGY